MIKYIVCKEIEVDEDCFETENLAVFDTEEAAVRMAAEIYEGLSEFGKEYYGIAAWKYSGAQLDLNDWDTIEEGETVAYYPAKVSADYEEEPDDTDYAKWHDRYMTVNFCLSPMRDGVRLWLGEDTDKYVDRECIGNNLDLAFALADWYKKYERIIEKDWKECFPQRNRKMYLNHIIRQGYSCEEALEILRYLPQTVTDVLLVDVSKMIELWKMKAPVFEPYRMPLWKKMILQGTDDLWKESIKSPGSDTGID